MKIIFLTPQVPPSVNGVGEYTVQFGRGLRQLGVETELLTSAGQTAVEPWIRPVISGWNRREILKALKPFEADWISLQYVPQMYDRRGICPEIAALPSFLKKNTKAAISVTFHEFQASWGGGVREMVWAAMLKFQTLKLLKGCDSAITTCARYAEILNSYPAGAGKVDVIPVGANILPAEDAWASWESLRARYGIGDGKVFAVFGRLASFRRTGLAVKALAAAREKGIPAWLFLIGGMRHSSPELFAELEKEAGRLGVQDWMIETGELAPAEISRYLAASDVFLFPQIDGISTRSTAALSAMAHGLPIVSFEPYPGNFDGWKIPHAVFTPRADEGAFLREAVHFLSQKTDAIKRRENSVYFETHFSRERLARDYRAALSGKRRG